MDWLHWESILGDGLSAGVVKLIHIYDTCFVGSIRVAIGSSCTPSSTLIHHPCFYSGEEALHGGRVVWRGRTPSLTPLFCPTVYLSTLIYQIHYWAG
jgi:hypothetical protein